MTRYNYRRFIKRHLDRIEYMFEKEGLKLYAISEQYQKDHPEIAEPLAQASFGARTIIDVIRHVKTLI